MRGDLETALQQGVMCILNEQAERAATKTQGRIYRRFVGLQTLKPVSMCADCVMKRNSIGCSVSFNAARLGPGHAWAKGGAGITHFRFEEDENEYSFA